MLAVFDIAVRYQMYHALALLAVSWAQTRWPGPALQLSGYAFLAGTILFQGLYILSLTGVRWLGAYHSLGGVAFLIGWLALAGRPGNTETDPRVRRDLNI